MGIDRRQLGQVLVLLLLLIGLVVAVVVILRPRPPRPLTVRPSTAAALAVTTATPGKTATHGGSDWTTGPVLEADGFRLVTLLPPGDNYGISHSALGGPVNCGTAGYCALRIQPLVAGLGPYPVQLRYYKVVGEALQPAGEFPGPAEGEGMPLLAWPDGRVLALVETMGADGYGKAPGPVVHTYRLLTASDGTLKPSAEFSYTSNDPMALDAAYNAGTLQLMFHLSSPPDGPFAVDVWHCAPGKPGRALPPVQVVATGAGWRNGERVNVTVDAQGQLLVDSPGGTKLTADPRWQAACKPLLTARSHFRQLALADDFVMFDTQGGAQLVALDGSQHLISSGRPRVMQDPAGKPGQMIPVADSCGQYCMVQALDEHTLLLLDNSFNRFTLIRRAAAAH